MCGCKMVLQEGSWRVAGALYWKMWSCSIGSAGPPESDAVEHTSRPGMPVRRRQFRQVSENFRSSLLSSGTIAETTYRGILKPSVRCSESQLQPLAISFSGF